MSTVESFDSTVEKRLNAGSALFELCADEDTALVDAWEGDTAPLKVGLGRVGIESAASDHIPEIVLTSYLTEPGPLADGFELVGQVEVAWDSDHVELWSSASDVGQARQLRLPPSKGGRYSLRASRAFSPKVQGSLANYLDEHPGKVKGLERWHFDFWPT